MNTLQIERILRKDPYCKKIFKGVNARDEIKLVFYPSAYVINGDPSTSPGKHWNCRILRQARKRTVL